MMLKKPEDYSYDTVKIHANVCYALLYGLENLYKNGIKVEEICDKLYNGALPRMLRDIMADIYCQMTTTDSFSFDCESLAYVAYGYQQSCTTGIIS